MNPIYSEATDGPAETLADTKRFLAGCSTRRQANQLSTWNQAGAILDASVPTNTTYGQRMKMEAAVAAAAPKRKVRPVTLADATTTVEFVLDVELNTVTITTRHWGNNYDPRLPNFSRVITSRDHANAEYRRLRAKGLSRW